MENLPPQKDDQNIPEEEPIPGQAPAAPVRFGQPWVGGQIRNNNNGWLEEDLEEDPEEEDDDEEDPEEGDDEEEEIEVDDEEDPEEDPEEGDDEEEEMEVDDEENNSEVSDPDEPPPPVFQFGQNFHVGESSSTRTLLDDNSQRYTTEFKIRNKFIENDLRMNSQEIKASTNYSDMMRLIKGLSKQIEELTLQCSRGKHLSQWEAQVSPHIPEGLRFREEPPIPSASIPHADDPYVMIRDAAMAAQEDDDDDADVTPPNWVAAE
ncbi:hypothetical protein Tco_0923284 [Tanacetum coccineum]|uniref:Uncharacterized protein n=1 Tax=Tanacetum coccineum TaxID=301880 RepID=A0ABQ5D0J7_9ASTR